LNQVCRPRESGDLGRAFAQGLHDLRDGLSAGARNMIGIGVATAAAGIIVGTVTLTGIGLKMTEFVEFISGGYLMLMLIFTAIISLILGMGLPTTANYIVVSTLMAPVVVELGAQSGLIVPLIAVHLFVFYFGIMADVTPPVGLASFAAAAVSGGDPIKTGVTAFWYSMRTAAAPARRQRPGGEPGRRRLDHRLGPCIRKMLEAECHRVQARRLRQLVHERFDREHIGERAQRTQRRGPQRQAAHQVLDQVWVGEGVERLEVAVDADMVPHRRLGLRRFQRFRPMAHRQQPPGAGTVGAASRPHAERVAG
jgi:hypothetical protein